MRVFRTQATFIKKRLRAWDSLKAGGVSERLAGWVRREGVSQQPLA